MVTGNSKEEMMWFVCPLCGEEKFRIEYGKVEYKCDDKKRLITVELEEGSLPVSYYSDNKKLLKAS